MVHRYCEEFGCSITQAIYDLENAPYGLIYEVLDLRHFMRVKVELDKPTTKDSAKNAPTGPMTERVMAAAQTILAERKEQRLGPNSG
jgi:hypothetical protein